MAENKIPYKIYLEEDEMPKAWYNVRADMKNKPAPLLNPGTHQPMTAEELGGVFFLYKADVIKAEFFDHNLGGFKVEALIDCCHDAVFEEFADKVCYGNAESFR